MLLSYVEIILHMGWHKKPDIIMMLHNALKLVIVTEYPGQMDGGWGG